MTKTDELDCQIDYDTREGTIARRNVLFGLWAGRRMGLTGEGLETYAYTVHLVDKRLPGHDDVIEKVASDLAMSRVSLTDRQLRARLREMELRATLDLTSNDHHAVSPSSQPSKRSQGKSRRTCAPTDSSH
jgi:hypothetical protein